VTSDLRPSAPSAEPGPVSPVGGDEGGAGATDNGTVGVRRRRVGTAVRLAALQALLLAVVLGLAVFGLLRAFESQSTTATTRTMTTELRAFEAATAHRPAGQSLREMTVRYLRTRVLPAGELVVVTLPGGAVRGSAGSGWLVRDPAVRGWAANPPARTQQLQLEHPTSGGTAEHSSQVLAAPLVSGGRTLGTIVVAADRARAESDVSRVRNLALGEALLALIAGTVGGYLLLRRLLRRIGRITATAADLGRGELDRRLGDQGTDDEVGQLASTFDGMADRVSAAMTSQRRLLSDVSHQLRTPLTVARGHLEVLQLTGADDPQEVRETVALVVDEIDHMRALVERLLMLGRALEPDFLEPVPVDLRSFCADLVEAARVLAVRNWALSPTPDVVVEVDAAKVRGALLNLVDNAVRATGVDDTIAHGANVTDGAVVLAVEDSGPGIPPAQREAVVQRFARPGAADSHGSGLGLAIVNAVATAHGGTLTLTESALGGLRAAMTFPSSVLASVEEV
jgi:signal transduction histidine kinase